MRASLTQHNAWSRLNGVEYGSVEIAQHKGFEGLGLFANGNIASGNVVVKVPKQLILSRETVLEYAKLDRALHQLLKAVWPTDRSHQAIVPSTRTHVILFLALQWDGSVGTKGPYAFYLQSLPQNIPLPTTWTQDEQALVAGTSLAAALSAKKKSLAREFAHFQEATRPIQWCCDLWWKDDAFTLDDWIHLDAAYRSRGLDLPGIGNALVPCIDMANHAGLQASASFHVRDDAVVLQSDKSLKPDDEVTIDYGIDKSACEMLYSYGFLDERAQTAGSVLLDLVIPSDDPLRLPKTAFAKTAPGIDISWKSGVINITGPFVWLLCVNEEDGLEMGLAERLDGERELQVSWRSQPVKDIEHLASLVDKDDLFCLRATVVHQNRLSDAIQALEDTTKDVAKIQDSGNIRADIEAYAIELRDLELELLKQAHNHVVLRRDRLLESPAVKAYLKQSAEDFA